MTRDSTASPWDSLSCYSSRRNILKNLNIVKGRQKPLQACWKIGKTFKKFISLNLGSSISNCANYYHGHATDITICLCQKFETSFRGKVIWTQSSIVSFNHSSMRLRFRVHFSVNGFYKGCNYILLFFRYLTTKRVAVVISFSRKVDVEKCPVTSLISRPADKDFAQHRFSYVCKENNTFWRTLDITP